MIRDFCQFEHNACTSMFHSLLRNRSLCVSLLLGSAVYFLFSWNRVSLMQCPIRELFDVKCPGCGLTSAVVHLGHGQFILSLYRHALAIPYLIVFLIMAVVTFSPNTLRDHLLHTVEASEKRTHWFVILGILTVIYGLTRHLIPSYWFEAAWQ